MAAAIVKKVKACLEQNVFKVLSDETFLSFTIGFLSAESWIWIIPRDIMKSCNG